MTRATEIFWVIGGDLYPKGNELRESSPFTNLKGYLSVNGQVTHFARPDDTTIARLRRKASQSARAKSSC